MTVTVPVQVWVPVLVAVNEFAGGVDEKEEVTVGDMVADRVQVELGLKVALRVLLAEGSGLFVVDGLRLAVQPGVSVKLGTSVGNMKVG